MTVSVSVPDGRDIGDILDILIFNIRCLGLRDDQTDNARHQNNSQGTSEANQTSFGRTVDS